MPVKVVKIKRVEKARIDPRYKFEYFRANGEDWHKLNDGQVIEVPVDLFSQLAGVDKAEATKPLPSARTLETEDNKGVKKNV